MRSPAMREEAAPAARANRPAPTTAAGYAAMFDELDPAEWGAADVAISVPLPDGRVVWLFGDTMSVARLVHSSAIVQTGGCLHVSRGGTQLLPDDDPDHVYWIDSARVVPDGIEITARGVELTGNQLWDFRDAGFERTALVRLDGDDLVFDRWLARCTSPEPDPGPLIVIDPENPHHFGYARHRHPEARLASGRMLVTTSQNWDDGRLHPFSDYRPLFSEQ